jgi:transposase
VYQKGVNMAKGKPFPPEFRAEAVRLYRMGNRSKKEIASEIGVSLNALNRWVSQAKIDKGETAGLTSEEKDELRSLRRENKLLREEKEILRKAALFFARETDQRK